MDFVQIPLGGNRGAGLFALVDVVDEPMVREYTWHLGAGGYARTRLNEFEGVQMHVLIFGDNLLRDHRNGRRLDNRRGNLRLATRSQNNINRAGWSSTGFKGVRLQGNSYVARIQVEGRSIHIGSFATAEQAARAYDRVAVEKFGEFAWLNFPLELMEEVS